MNVTDLRRRWMIRATLLVIALSGGGSVFLAQQERRQPPRVLAPQARRGFEVKLIEPVDGAIMFGASRILAEVKVDDPSKVLDVTFWVGDELIFVDKEEPFQTVYNFGSEARSVVVRAVARHAGGFSVETAIVTRQIHLSYVVEVRRVVLSVTVMDGRGTPVIGLGRDDFVVFEDGEEQQILDFNVEERPLRMGMVVDTSGSMRDRLTQVQLAAAGFLEVLRPEDRAMVVDFDDQVLLLQGLTDSHEDLRDALMSTFARGGTAMYDAIKATLRRLADAGERKAIVLLSDGGDTASVSEKSHAIEAARTSDVLIYAIGVGGGTDRSVLKDVSEETGGRAFFVDKAGELGATYQRIADELRNQYILAYASSNPEYDGAWREIKVRFVGKGDFKVRARKGYYALRRPDLPLEAPLPAPAPAAAATEPGPGSPTTDPGPAEATSDGAPAPVPAAEPSSPAQPEPPDSPPA